MQIDCTGLCHICNAVRYRNVILNIIRREASISISRKESAEISKLSIATTKHIIEELIRDRFVVEMGVNESTRS